MKDIVLYYGDHGQFYETKLPEGISLVIVRWDDIEDTVFGCKRCKLTVDNDYNFYTLELRAEHPHKHYDEVIDWSFFEEKDRDYVKNDIEEFLKENNMVLKDDGWYYPQEKKKSKKRDVLVVKPINDQPKVFLAPDDINFEYLDWETVEDIVDGSDRVQIICEEDEEAYTVHLQGESDDGLVMMGTLWDFYEEKNRNRVAFDLIDYLEEKGFKPSEDNWYVKQEER